MYDGAASLHKEQSLTAAGQFGSITLAFTSAAARLPGAAKRDVKTVTGNVVDAACFMIHPSVADAVSHKECGTACMKRGVPLAIAGDDGSLYFPADGNTRLSAFHGQRVKVTGTVTEKKEPMELKMPVGEKNTMTVKVEGGDKVIAMESVVEAATGHCSGIRCMWLLTPR